MAKNGVIYGMDQIKDKELELGNAFKFKIFKVTCGLNIPI